MIDDFPLAEGPMTTRSLSATSAVPVGRSHVAVAHMALTVRAGPP
jgi:hypothetical protein